jgi:hypothetical protein
MTENRPAVCDGCPKRLVLFGGLIAGKLYCFACWIVRA